MAHLLAFARSPSSCGVANTEAGEKDQDHDQDWRHWEVFSFTERFVLPDIAFSWCSCVDMMMSTADFLVRLEKSWAAICLRSDHPFAVS
ncbi:MULTISPECIES: hypothetical protein [unclassified Bradyrhizobium]|uniref:Secreted protein n=1 Tax=Bradyrhizobium sp. LLZ17 TaxID=3239388 RepID=A0AB39XS47_9BRAD